MHSTFWIIGLYTIAPPPKVTGPPKLFTCVRKINCFFIRLQVYTISSIWQLVQEIHPNPQWILGRSLTTLSITWLSHDFHYCSMNSNVMWLQSTFRCGLHPLRFEQNRIRCDTTNSHLYKCWSERALVYIGEVDIKFIHRSLPIGVLVRIASYNFKVTVIYALLNARMSVKGSSSILNVIIIIDNFSTLYML